MSEDYNSECDNYDGESFENDDVGIEKHPRSATITDIVESLNKPKTNDSKFHTFCLAFFDILIIVAFVSRTSFFGIL